MQSVSAPQTVQYGGKEMVIPKAIAPDKSGLMGVTFHLQLVNKVKEGKSSHSTAQLLEEAVLEAQFVDDMINEKVIRSVMQ